MSRVFHVVYFFLLAIFAFGGCTNQAPRAIEGENLFEKELFYQAPMTWITHIAPVSMTSESSVQVGIFGQKDMHVVHGETGILKRRVEFDWPSGVLRPEVISGRRNGEFEIMVRGGGFGDVGLIDQDGKCLWTYRPGDKLPPNDMAAGDLDRNGETEFYVAERDGLHKLSQKGEKIWRVGDWINHVEVHDSNKSGSPTVLAVPFRGPLQFWDTQGQLVRELKPDMDVNNIAVCQWPSQGNILVSSDSTFYVLDGNGKIVLRHSLKRHIYRIKGTVVSFSDNQLSYFAVLAKHSSSVGRSTLCIFSSDGTLIYKELLAVTTGLLAFTPESSRNQVLFVGDGPGKVYKYRLKDKRGKSAYEE